MKEVKTPKKPFIYYLIIAATIMILLNTLVFPNVLKHQVKEVGYNVFMQMTNNQEIGSVNITDSEIFFTNKDNSQMYKTGVINDPELVDRLYKAGATFSTEITEEMSPIVYLLLGYVLPIFIFVALGRWLSKKMMSKMSDGANPMNSMMFGTKSNAKIYVKSTSGHQILRCGRRGRSKRTAYRDRRFPSQSRQISGNRSIDAKRCTACRPSGNR